MHRHVKGQGRATPPPQAAPAVVHDNGAEELQSSSLDAANPQAEVCIYTPLGAVCVNVVASVAYAGQLAPGEVLCILIDQHALCHVCISVAAFDVVCPQWLNSCCATVGPHQSFAQSHST